MRIYSANNVFIEVTRRCNMCCAHCLRGDAESIDVYKMHEDILNQRYHESVQTVLAELKKVIPRIELTGQWSVDVMRNGNDYYIIDMALAENSALNDCVPSNRLRAYPQQWLPGESNS